MTTSNCPSAMSVRNLKSIKPWGKSGLPRIDSRGDRRVISDISQSEIYKLTICAVCLDLGLGMGSTPREPLRGIEDSSCSS